MALLLFAFLWVSFAWFYHTGGHNENAHVDQIRALADEGRWDINEFVGNTADIIRVDDKFYPNKAPGITLLGVLPWKVFRTVLGWTSLSDGAQLHFTSYLVQLTTLGLFSALTGSVLWLFLARVGLSQVAALFFALLYSIGTIAFPFSTIFFSHQLAASFLFLGFFLLWKLRQETSSSQSREAKRHAQVVLAGLLLGFAPVLEYPAALGTVVIGCYGLTNLSRRRFCLFFVAGVAAGSSLLFYNWCAFHQLVYLSYEAYLSPGASFGGHAHGFLGVGWPRADVLWNITFGRQRGLFYANPWLCLIVPALVTLRSRTWRRELIVSFALVATFLAFNSGFGDSVIYWGGAWSIGPRHLVPMLPFMALPIALLCRRRPFAIAALALGCFSVGAMFGATAITPCVPYEAAEPWGFYLHQIFLGRFSLNAGGIWANRFLPGLSSNLGQLLGLPPRTQMLPLALLWAVFVPILFRQVISETSDRFVPSAPFCFAGGILALGLLPLVYWPRVPRPAGWVNGLAGVMAPGPFVENTSSANADAAFVDQAQARRGRSAVIDFLWDGNDSPFRPPFGGIWTGAIYAPVTGTYSIAVDSDDGSALYIDGIPVIDHWRTATLSRKNVNAIFSQGFHALALHYENAAATGRLRLSWSPPGVPEEIVPPEYLFSPEHAP
ncbi:MAG: PA14 domain-containing protein [Chthoniobacterales bacterium]